LIALAARKSRKRRNTRAAIEPRPRKWTFYLWLSSPAAWRCSPRSAAPRCCGFLATPRNISRFDPATGLTNLGSEVEHDWALAGGLAMGAHRSLTLSARGSLGPARTMRCDHCREEFGSRVHRYWHMHFCSSACVTAYQRRLGPETKVKISQLEASRESLAAA
jgi:hypothetical protein